MATAGGSGAGRPTALPTFLPDPIDYSKFPQSPVDPRAAKRTIEGLRSLDATPRLNLASFVTTYM